MSQRPNRQCFELSLLPLLVALLVGLLAAVPIAQAGAGVSGPYQGKHAVVSLHAEYPEFVPGKPFQLALRIQAEPGWHTYWKNPGDTGLATRINWDLPDGLRAGEIEWPTPERIDYQGMINLGYHGEAWLLTTLIASPVQTYGESLDITAEARWLICREVCIPDKATFQLSLPVATAQSPADPRFAQARARLPGLIVDESAQFGRDEQGIWVSLAADGMPVWQSQPTVFFGEKGIVDNLQPARLEIADDRLLLRAVPDAYLESLPSFLAVTLASAAQAVEVVARQSDAGAPTSTPAPRAAAPDVTATVEQPGLATALLFALLGGLVLNAMPCVFPVLSLKVISLVEAGAHTAAQRRSHGLAYTAGVISSFLLVAGLLIALRAAGEQIGWGFQLQSPAFIAFLVYLLAVLGLSLSGVVELGSSLQNLGGRWAAAGQQPLRGSFFTGVLATVVATPCTAPFMGAAMGFALSQPAAVSLLVFAVMGFGLALPFVLIAFVPALAAALPRPGDWMVRLKEFLAFPIYLTVVWLLWVFARQTGSDAVGLLLAGLVLLALALWIWRHTQYREDLRWLQAAALLCVVLAVAAVPAALRSAPAQAASEPAGSVESQDGAVAWSPAALQAALDGGAPVFVNMTADWCITCKLNERVALATDSVQSHFAALGVKYLKGDWTHSDPDITGYLESFGRNGVPLYVYYAPGQAPVILPQLLTPEIVREHVQ